MGRERRADVSGQARLGLLFPGQGSQYVGMGKDLAAAFPEARAAFEEADDALGASLSRLCWEGPEDELTLTINAQPAILTHSAAVWRVIAARRPDAVLAAGHSLGEFSAYLAAGSFGFADAVRTVRRRGELMYRSGEQRPGTMAAIIGLDDATAEQICRATTDRGEGVVVPANYNAPGQIVISGDVAAVARAEEPAKEAGAKRVIPLNVSGAFHSPLMQVAEDGLREQLGSVDLRDPAFPVVSNVTAQPVAAAAEARELLVRQLTSPVRWVASMRTMLEAGISDFIEIGPGNVLAGLLRRVDRGAVVKSLGTVEDIEAYLMGAEANQREER
jgi:[acyl-carrier-protein] S-malonyltransferase